MKAIVATAFPGREDHASAVRTILIGETISGELAKVAIDQGWAEEPEEDEGDGLDRLNVAKLTELAEAEEIDLGDAKKKSEIIAAIREARAAKAVA